MIGTARINTCFALFLIIAILAILTSPFVHGQSNTEGVAVNLSGPSVVGTLRGGTYSATLVDSLNRDWDYKVYITASNLTGASPLIDSPINGTLTQENRTFAFDITAPQKEGDIELHINCTSGTFYYNKVQKIFCVKPISFSIEVNNPSNVEIKNATVQFYINDLEIEKKTIQSIGAGQTITVTSEWISNDKKPGWYTSKIMIDMNGDGKIDTNTGDIIVEDRFYIEGNRNWFFALIVLVGIIALIIGFGYLSKRKIK